MVRSTYLGVDVGATNLRVGIFSESGEMIDSLITATPTSGGPDAVANKIVALGEELLRKHGLVNQLKGIGVGTIGPLNLRRGEVVGTPNNPLRRFRLREPLESHFGVVTYVVNDCVAAVWGEYLVGAGSGRRNVVYVTISSGVGGGAVVNGNLLLGKDGNAHEVGHIVVDVAGRRCGCGGVGHWEAYASGSTIPGFLREEAEVWEGESYLKERALEGGVSPEELFKYWREGDPFAEHVVSKLVRIHAAGIGSVINVYDPEVLTVGGSVALKNRDFMELVFKHVKEYVINRLPEMMLTPLGDRAVLIGAALVAIKPPKSLLEYLGEE